MPRSSPYVPHALLPVHHISLRARQLSRVETYSQFSSPSNRSKYSHSSLPLGQSNGTQTYHVAEAGRNPLDVLQHGLIVGIMGFLPKHNRNDSVQFIC